MLKLVDHDDDVLLLKARAVESFDEELKVLIEELSILMYENSGVGIAAPQAGVSKRVIVIDPSGGYGDNLRVIINPKITWFSSTEEVDVEGCLSFPGTRVNVKRSASIEVEYLDFKGDMHVVMFNGFPARIVQHEIDHLDGVTMIDRASQEERSIALKNVKQIFKGIQGVA